MKRFFIFSFVFWSGLAFAQEELLLQDLNVELDEASSAIHDESLQRVYDYRMQVEENSYIDTMRLCVAYRQVRGLKIPQIHTLENSYSQHEEAQVRELVLDQSEAFEKVESASLQAWLNILEQGAKQPFSAQFGFKAEANETHLEYQIDPFSLETLFHKWFVSLYSMFLVNSEGFLKASLHCLGDLSLNEMEKEIENFRFVILFVDSQTGVLVYNGLFWTGEIIFELLLKGVLITVNRGVVKKSVGHVVSSARSWNRSLDEILKLRVSNPSLVKKRLVYSTAVASTGVVGYLMYRYFDKKNQQEQELQETLQEALSDLFRQNSLNSL